MSRNEKGQEMTDLPPIMSDNEMEFVVRKTSGLPEAEANLVAQQVFGVLEAVQERVVQGDDPEAIVLTQTGNAHPLSRPIVAAILRYRASGGTFAADE
jgi:hypothetical protein